MDKNPEIWALIDDKPGHRNQVIGVAEALKMPYRVIKLAFNEKSGKPNFLKGANLNTLDLKESDNISAPWPDIIISAGRRTVPVVKYIKNAAKKSDKKKTFACQIMWPGFPAQGLDLIAVPAHDRLSKMAKSSKNIFITQGAPNLVSSDFLKQEYRIWSSTFGALPNPRIVFLLGGNSKKIEMTMSDASIISKKLVKLMNNLKGSLYISSSRRTPKDVAQFIFDETKRKVGLNIFNHNFNEQKTRANPYYALLEAADVIIITADSISMCSEACSTGKPVFIYQPEIFHSEKHRKFMEGMIEKNYAYEFNDGLESLSLNQIRGSINKKYNNPAKDIAKKIMTEMKLR